MASIVIKFILESDGLQAQFLDTLIVLSDNVVNTSWYRKPQVGNNYLNFFSKVPFQSKIATVTNTVKQIQLICNNDESKSKDLEKFRSILNENGYPRWFINKYGVIRKH